MLGPAALDALERRLEPFDRLSPSAAATDEEFWAEIRKAFPVPADYINLENGYSSPQPATTYEAFQRHQADINGGFGIRVAGLLLDYAYTYQTELLYVDGTHHLTMRFSF